jgi:hypothetical protein
LSGHRDEVRDEVEGQGEVTGEGNPQRRHAAQGR